MNQVIGRLVIIGRDGSGPVGTVDVRGARMRVSLLLTPEARVGDLVLIDAGVAVAILPPDVPAPNSTQG